ncbi:uncharacterized protein LOC124498834 [Dermatophagoides farinae]|uniref:uncharacterized protein LOC124498834 n=1 Tax=Dermatophagoides farinae TaxID=6954 RepID=UPI003F603F1E
MAIQQRHCQSIFICLIFSFITSHLLIAHDCNGNEHRYSRLWWYEVKNNGTNSTTSVNYNHTVPSPLLLLNSSKLSIMNYDKQQRQPQHFGLTDNELMTQASKLSSKMTRIMVPTATTTINTANNNNVINSNGHINNNDHHHHYHDVIHLQQQQQLLNQNLNTISTRFDDDVNENGSQLFQQQPQQQIFQFKKETEPENVLINATTINNNVNNGQEKPAASNSRPFFQSPSSSFGTHQSLFNGFIQQQQQQQQQQRQRFLPQFRQHQQQQQQHLLNPTQPQHSYSDRIWNFFDTNINRGMNNQRPKSWRTFDQQQQQQQNQELNDSGSINSIVDSYIEKLMKRNQLRSNSSSSASTTNMKNSKSQKDDNNSSNTLSLNMNRKKNPEEKEKFRKLIQTIFDNTPRKSFNYGSASGFDDDDDDDNDNDEQQMIHQQKNDSTSDEDSFMTNDGDQNETNGNKVDENVTDNHHDGDEDIVDKIVDNNDDVEVDTDSDSDSDDLTNDDDDDDDEDEPREAAGRLIKKEPKIEQSSILNPDDDDEVDNQYLRNNNTTNREQFGARKTIQRKTTTAGNSSIVRQQKRHNHHHHHNLTAPAKKKFLFNNRNSFQTTTPPSSSSIMMTTTTENPLIIVDSDTTVIPTKIDDGDGVDISGEMDESLNLSDENFVGLEELNLNSLDNQTITTTTTTTTTNQTPTIDEDDDDENLKNQLIRKRKPQHVGKWMDAETFELRNDDDNDDDDDDDENEDDADDHHKLSVSTKSPPVVDIDFKPVVRKPVMLGKDHFLISTNNKHRLSNNLPRFIRQNKPTTITNDESMIQLEHTLPGMPGEDYPVFSSIPRTRFNCLDHKWPGYYADIDTHCQVFHICQSGGRKNSFLCPNGTMFNQRLFICDWWHNVQCDEQAEHYELNAQIYNDDQHNWDSIRLKTVTGKVIESKPKSQPLRVSIRRMALLDNIDNSTDDQSTTTTALDLIDNQTTTTTTTELPTTTTMKSTFKTTESPLFITESSLPFGARHTKFRHQTSKLKNLDRKSLSLLQEREQTTTTTASPITAVTTTSTAATTIMATIRQPIQQQRKYSGVKGGGNGRGNVNGELSKFSRVIQEHKAKSSLSIANQWNNHHFHQQKPQLQQQQQKQKLKQKQKQQIHSPAKISDNNNVATKFTRHKFAHQSQLTRTTQLPQLLSTSSILTNGHSSSSSSSKSSSPKSSSPKSLRFQSSPTMMIMSSLITPAPMRISTRPGKYYRT